MARLPRETLVKDAATGVVIRAPHRGSWVLHSVFVNAAGVGETLDLTVTNGANDVIAQFSAVLLASTTVVFFAPLPINPSTSSVLVIPIQENLTITPEMKITFNDSGSTLTGKIIAVFEALPPY